MKKTSSVLLAIGVILLFTNCQSPHATISPTISTGKKIRVGTFDRTKLLVAFYSSEHWNRALRELQSRKKAAQAREDNKAVEELEARGASLQTRAHQQLSGEASLSEIIKAFEKTLPDIAKKAGVSLVVEKPLYHDREIEFVDLTEEIIFQFSTRTKEQK